jgi:dephospho-CoA kinase
MYVIGTVGLPGSGKGEAAAVARELDIPVVTMGDVVRAATRDRGLDPEVDHGRVARALREEEGEAAIARRSLPHIRDHLATADTVLIDGLRSPAEVDVFENEFGDAFALMSVEAPFETRAERLRGRARDRSDEDDRQLRERERRERDFGMDEVMDRADVVVENADSLAAFHDRMYDLLADPDRIRDGEDA